MIVIDNPVPPSKQAKLVDTVLQVLPPDSNTNKLLRFGSRAYSRSKPEYNKFKSRKSMPHIDSLANLGDLDSSVETKVLVHRTLSWMFIEFEYNSFPSENFSNKKLL